MIKIGSKKVPNMVTELTVEQFEKVSSFINSNELEPFEKWVNVFEYLGADENEINEMEFAEFRDLVKEYNNQTEKQDIDFVKSVEIDGYTYQSFEDEFKLSVRDLKYIEKSLKNDPNNYMAKMLAIIFKRTDLTTAEHYADAHIKFKTKLFKQQKASLVIPFAVHVGKKLGESIEKLKDENPETVE